MVFYLVFIIYFGSYLFGVGERVFPWNSMSILRVILLFLGTNFQSQANDVESWYQFAPPIHGKHNSEKGIHSVEIFKIEYLPI